MNKGAPIAILPPIGTPETSEFLKRMLSSATVTERQAYAVLGSHASTDDTARWWILVLNSALAHTADTLRECGKSDLEREDPIAVLGSRPFESDRDREAWLERLPEVPEGSALYSLVAQVDIEDAASLPKVEKVLARHFGQHAACHFAEEK